MKVPTLQVIAARNIHQIPNMKSTIENMLKNQLFPSKITKELKINIVYNILKEKSHFISKYTHNHKENILLSGCVQSGKTNEMLFYCWWSIFIAKRSIILLTRNIKADIQQLKERIQIFNEKFISKKYKVCYLKMDILKQSNKINKKRIMCAMANFKQVEKLNILSSNINYNLCIDESDLSVKSRNNSSRLEEHLCLLENNSKHQLGATATDFAVISTKEELTNVYRMPIPENYHGLNSLNIKYTKIPKGLNISKFPDLDPNIENIYNTFLQKPHGIMLHSVSKFRYAHRMIMTDLRNKFPQMTILVFNGDGIVLLCHNKHSNRDFMPQGKFYNKFNLNLRIGKYTYHRFTGSIKINEVLQILKEDPQTHTHITIIAGYMASRGISIVSSDYKWHLTDQYFHPSDGSHGEHLLQSLRILGIYKDNPKLTLWCTKVTWKDIKEQYKHLKKFVKKSIGKSEPHKNFQEIEIEPPTRLYTRSSVMKGIRMIPGKEPGKIKFQVVKRNETDNVKKDE